jgi:hypothetical protein
MFLFICARVVQLFLGSVSTLNQTAPGYTNYIKAKTATGASSGSLA